MFLELYAYLYIWLYGIGPSGYVIWMFLSIYDRVANLSILTLVSTNVANIAIILPVIASPM